MHGSLRSVSVALALCLGACGGGSAATPDGGGSGLLVGSWFQQVTPVTADDQTMTITFAANGALTFLHSQVSPATSSAPGCTETCSVPGTYTATATTVTTTADTSASVGAYANCTDPAQNGPTSPSSCSSLTATFAWSIAGDTLTLTDPSNPASSLSFTRR